MSSSKSARRKNRQAREHRKAKERRKNAMLIQATNEVRETARATASSLKLDLASFRPRPVTPEQRKRRTILGVAIAASILIVIGLAWFSGIQTPMEIFQLVWMWILFGLGTLHGIYYIVNEALESRRQNLATA